MYFFEQQQQKIFNMAVTFVYLNIRCKEKIKLKNKI